MPARALLAFAFVCATLAAATPIALARAPQNRSPVPTENATDADALTAGCKAGHDLILSPNQVYSVAHSLTLDCHLHTQGAQFNVATGATLSLLGSLDAPPSPLFRLEPGASVHFGPLITEAPVEWFGAVGDGTTDDTRAIQSTLDALSAGHAVLAARSYLLTAPLLIQRSLIGVRGLQAGYNGVFFPARDAVSTLITNSPSIDMLVLRGTPQRPSFWNDFRNFTLQRTVKPAGTATGLSISFSGGYQVDQVQSHDSVRDFYFHQGPNDGVGVVSRSNAGWLWSGVAGYSQADTVYGFYLDSADGAPENTISFHNDGAGSSGTSPAQSYGMYIQGVAINDVDVDFLNVAGTTTCVAVLYQHTSSNAGASADLHFHNLTCDNYAREGVLVRNLNLSTLGSLDLSEGWITSIAPHTEAAVRVEDSTGVTLSRLQINAGDGRGVILSNSNGNSISNNLFARSTQTVLDLRHSSSNVIVGNVLRGSPDFPSATMLSLQDQSVNNTIIGNAFSGSATNGIAADASSSNNQFSANAIDPTAIAHPLSGVRLDTCPLAGSPRLSRGPGSGEKDQPLPSSSDSNCTFHIALTAGPAPAAGAPVASAEFTSTDGKPLLWPYPPACTLTPANADTAAIPAYLAVATGSVILGQARTSKLRPGLSYGWEVHCGL